MSLTGVIVGAGYFAGFHAEAWGRIPAVRLAAVADPVPGKARAFADRWGIPAAYESAAEMLDRERPDFADITTRPGAHLELTRLAAGRGVHVVCQKPMAPGWDDCGAMVGACDAAGVRLVVHENWRWQPWYREVKRLLDDGVIGRPFRAAFRLRTGDGRGPDPYPVQPYFRDMPRFLIHETLVHHLDTFRFLLGDVSTVYCRAGRANPVIRGEDWAVIQAGFAGGAAGLIDADRVSGPVPYPLAMNELELTGDRAAVRLAGDGRVWLTDHGAAEREHPFEFERRGFMGDCVYATQLHLADCLASGQPAETEGRDYLRTVRAVFACYESAETGRAVSLIDPAVAGTTFDRR